MGHASSHRRRGSKDQSASASTKRRVTFSEHVEVLVFEVEGSYEVSLGWSLQSFAPYQALPPFQDSSHSPHSTRSPRWTRQELRALVQFVHREDVVVGTEEPPTTAELTRRAMEKLVPGVVGPRDEEELWEVVRRIRTAGLAACSW